VTTASKTVLIVDDDAEIRELISRFLNRRQIQTMEAVNGIEAFKIVRSQKVDTVITDVRMPGGDGVTLLKKIMAEIETPPTVIVISGYSDLTEESAVKFGAKAYFNKPFDVQKLINAV
jgi:DNA-binding NtrC family response regulator